MNRRVVSFLLAVLMLVACVPACSGTALAAELDSKAIVERSGIWINPLYAQAGVKVELPKRTEQYTVQSYDTEADAVTQLRTALKNRNETIQLNVVTSAYAELDPMQLFDQALAHTGDPTGGDYLMWQYGGYGYRMSYSTQGDSSYYTINFSVVYYTTAEQETQVTTATNELLGQLGLYAATDYEKVCGIYDYICQNVTYDYENLNNNDYWLQYTAYGALVNGTSVCQGYAVLFYRLALELGVDSRVIVGYGNGGPHAWNIVELGGQYYNLDATWDASCVQSGLDYQYFLKGSENFGDHSRDADYTTEAFNAEYPTSELDYSNDTYSGLQEGNFKYDVVSGQAVITGYSGNEETVTIPATIDGYPVVEVGSQVFYNNDTVRSIVISEGVISFGGEWVYNCNNLESIHFPSTAQIGADSGGGAVTGISPVPEYCPKMRTVTVAEGNTSMVVYNGDLYTRDMKTLLYHPSGDTRTVLQIPDGVTTIESSACNSSVNLQEVVMPDTVTYIGYWAFCGSSNLAKINISAACEMIGQYAFNNTAIESIHIPASMQYIPPDAFGQTINLKTITVDPDSSVFCVQDGALYNKVNGILIKYASARDAETLTVMDGTVQIAMGAFCDSYFLKEVYLPDGLELIAYQAFFSCDNLEKIVIPATVTEIGEYVFANDHMLTIYGDVGSYAEVYAAENGYPFCVNCKWVFMDGCWYYYVGQEMQTGWQQIDGLWYYFNADGAMQTGWQQIDGKWYYLNRAMLTGWQQISGKWYYLNSEMKTGWQQIDGKWYYFDASGAMQTGWQYIDGGWHYLNSEMKTGWQAIDGKWYYFGTNGAMQKGWQYINGGWYYLNSEMKTGWQKIDGYWYYLNSEMKTGWQKIGGYWYYLNSQMQTGWLQQNGKWYYLGTNGAMVTGTQVIDGKTYTFDSNGVWIP